MELIPAIDLLDGRCVRLLQGDFEACQVYEQEPLELARRYRDQGARWLHLVDLAASRDGKDADSGPLYEFLRRAPLPVQTGGGVRSGSDIEERLAAGASRVVVGSLCVKETDRFIAWLQRFGTDRLVAALDVRIDADRVPRPRIYGWTEGAGVSLWTLLQRLADSGIRHVLVTDISRDGALGGPNLALYAEILRRFPDLRIQASGGVASLGDLRALARTEVAGAITGKALLEGRFTVSQALEALS